MIEQITQVIAEGFRPVIYIDDWLFKSPTNQEYLKDLKEKASKLDVLVVQGENARSIHLFNKLHVYRYGEIPAYTQAIIFRRKGRIVPGPF